MRVRYALCIVPMCALELAACRGEVLLGNLPDAGSGAGSGSFESGQDGARGGSGAVASSGFVASSGGIASARSGSGGAGSGALATPNGTCGSAPSGSGSSCPTMSHFTTATKIDVYVTWSAQAASDSGSGLVSLWLLTFYNFDGQGQLAGTVVHCGIVEPPLALNAVGKTAIGVSSIQDPEVATVFDPSTWEMIRTSNSSSIPVTGTLGGSSEGTPLRINQVVSLLGIRPGSTWSFDSTTWPSTESSILISDLVDNDGDAKPGITGSERNDPPFVMPRSGLGMSFPEADHLYLVYRTEFSLDGRESADCRSWCGSATVNLLDSHVVGCHLSTGADCDESGTTFLDANRTVLRPGTAMFTSVIVPDGATCTDVRNAIP
jgi:hypothetical protein